MGRSYIKVLLISKAVLHGAKEDAILFVQWQKCFLNLMIIFQSTIFFPAGRGGPIQQKERKKNQPIFPRNSSLFGPELAPPHWDLSPIFEIEVLPQLWQHLHFKKSCVRKLYFMLNHQKLVNVCPMRFFLASMEIFPKSPPHSIKNLE